MPEIVLHYIWQKGLFQAFPQSTTDHRSVQVISPGRHNLDAGPDFTDVHLLIDGIELVGQVEIHVDSHDWYYHHHDIDPAYNRILLHVVSHASQPIYNSLGQLIPQLQLNYNRDRDYVDCMLSDALQMDSAASLHRCAEQLLHDPSLITDGWKLTMLHSRLRCKTDSISRLLHLTHNDWRQAFYISLAHAFGFHVNGVPMELLAISTPISVLSHHRDRLDQLTALLLGQASLLKEDDPRQKEYLFLRHKYDLTPIDPSLWKHGRLRPQNSPELRITQLAQLLHKSQSLLSQCLETTDIPSLQSLFAPTQMGKDSINSLLINMVAPFVYARGQHAAAIALLQTLPKEDNRIIRQWRYIGQPTHSAADTQALLHLYQTYCESSRCLSCAVWSELSHT